MFNRIYKVFQVMSCKSLHDGKSSLILHTIVNLYNYEDTIVIDKTVDSSIGSIAIGDFFCMKKVNDSWEFAE